jgi:hypothetical protein
VASQFGGALDAICALLGLLDMSKHDSSVQSASADILAYPQIQALVARVCDEASP